MIRSWYRSRLFWLGVPGLVFLVWLWVDALISHRYLGFTIDRGPDVRLEIGLGAISCDIDSEGLEDPFQDSWISFHASREPADLESWRPWAFRAPFKKLVWETVDEDPVFGIVRRRANLMAAWVPMVLYSVGWIAAVARWQRWKLNKTSIVSTRAR